jgi:uncharacterized protein (TIGR03435 family)
MKTAVTAVLMVAVCSAQTSFEAATIKPIKPEERPRYGSIRVRGAQFSATETSMMDLIVNAFLVEAYQVVEGPKWLESEKFDIQARAAAAPTREQFRQMEQALLVERCRLKFRRETRELSVYGLVVAKNGPKFREGSPVQPPWPRNHMYFRNLKDVAAVFSRLLGLDRPVIDQTGRTGQYRLEVDTSEFQNPETRDGRDYRQFLQLAITEQLGLKLAPMKLPVEMMVVETVERPGEN